MSLTSIRADRARTPLVVMRGLAVGLALLAHTTEAQSQSFIVYDHGLTRTNAGTTDSLTILRDNPNPPPNPTTVILLDSFSLGPAAVQFYYRLEDSSVLDIRGGTLQQGPFAGIVDLYDASRLLMSGGSISQRSSQDRVDPAILAGGSSRIEISGGSLLVSGFSVEGGNGPGIDLRDDAALSISGGEFTALRTAIIESAGASHVTIDGGTFNADNSGIPDYIGNILTVDQSSVVDILGGTFTSNARGIEAYGNAVVNVRGGSFSFPFLTDVLPGFHGGGNGQIKVFGNNFALDSMAVGPGFIPHNGTLTGVLADGTPLNVLATGRVFLIPEPAGWLLALAAFLGVRCGLEASRSKRS
jgi:hypothetical protein